MSSITINTKVLFEIFLVCACFRAFHSASLIADVSTRQTWQLGIGSIGIAAFAGVFVFAGYEAPVALHSLLTRFAGTVGVVSMSLGAAHFWVADGVLSPHFAHRPYVMAAIILTFNVFVVVWASGKHGAAIVVQAPANLFLLAIAAHSPDRLDSKWLASGVAALLLAIPLEGPLSQATGLHPVDVFHICMALTILAFEQAILLHV